MHRRKKGKNIMAVGALIKKEYTKRIIGQTR